MIAVSLFSDCRGLDLGLERAGFQTVFASDLDPRCSASYTQNFPRVPFFEGNAADIKKATLDTVSKGATLAPIDLLAGGPPCPPFSKSRFYRKDKPRALHDAVGEETINAYLSVLEAVRPRGFILENVAGLAYKIHESALELIMDTATRLGYQLNSKVVNAADYGVPQSASASSSSACLRVASTFLSQHIPSGPIPASFSNHVVRGAPQAQRSATSIPTQTPTTPDTSPAGNTTTFFEKSHRVIITSTLRPNAGILTRASAMLGSMPALRAGGWHVVRVWEHVPIHEALETVLAALRAADQRRLPLAGSAIRPE